MNVHSKTGLIFSLAAMLMTVVFLPAMAGEIPKQLPDPDGKPAAANKPVQVFILLGQSNMLGFGRVDPVDKQGTLSFLVKKRRCIRT